MVTLLIWNCFCLSFFSLDFGDPIETDFDLDKLNGDKLRVGVSGNELDLWWLCFLWGESWSIIVGNTGIPIFNCFVWIVSR